MSQLKSVFATDLAVGAIVMIHAGDSRLEYPVRIVCIRHLAARPINRICFDWETYGGLGRGFKADSIIVPSTHVFLAHADSIHADPVCIRAAYLMVGLTIYPDDTNPDVPQNCVITKVRVIDPDSEQQGCVHVEWKSPTATGRFSFPANSFIKVREA